MNSILIIKRKLIITDNQMVYTIRNPFDLRTVYPHLRNRALVIGVVGPRGSGKSVHTARMTCSDYLLKNKKVWANMDIGFTLLNGGKPVDVHTLNFDKMSLVDLDTMYDDGCLVIEEANVTLMEARRAMREENLKSSYLLQQLRKRRMNMIWNAQSEMHVDDRLRFQTDIFVKCADLSLMPGHHHAGAGELSLIKYYDYSGQVTGKVSVEKGWMNPFWQGIVWNKPWWNTFSTWQLQGIEEAVSQKEGAIPPNGEEILEFIQQNQHDKTKLRLRNIWNNFDITDHRLRTWIGKWLSTQGIIPVGVSTYRRYTIAEGGLL